MPADTQSGMVKWFERVRLHDQSADATSARRSRSCWPSTARSRRSAPRSTTTSTASSTRSTGSTGRSGSASCRARRAGRSRTSSPPSRRRRVLKDIEIQVGRTGALTPVAKLEPVDGRRRRGAERDPAQRGRDRSVSDVRIGDTVIVQRAGDVIPQVLGVVLEKRPRDAKPYKFPDELPVPAAHRRRARGDRRRRGGRARRCTGEFACPYPGDRAPEALRVAPRLRHRGPRREADRVLLRAGLGQGAGRHLHAARTRNRRGSSCSKSAKAIGETSVRNLFAAIEARREIALDRFIYALGIRHVGETTARGAGARLRHAGRRFTTRA